MRSLHARVALLLAALACTVAAVAPSALAAAPATTEIVVGLDAPPLADALAHSRVLTAVQRRRRLDVGSITSRAYLRDLGRLQDAVARRIERAIPGSWVHWRYEVVVDALAVVVPTARVQALGRVPGIATIYANTRYHALLNRSPEVIGANDLWGPNLDSAGNGMKIAILDDGIDQTHPFFNPAGYTMPPGFPKGQKAYTTAKVIVAKAFVPPGSHYKYAHRPYDPQESDHATHVAGIAAGDHDVTADVSDSGTLVLSGVAPRAYLGNYKVLTQPTDAGVGLDGNAAEIAAGIEAAVKDGMDVINLSLGEPEITPGRDLVVAAIDGAASAGVVTAVAAGNDFDEFGAGSVGSPGTAPSAITAAAATKTSVVADFSSAGPTPISLQMKPDVTAPGVAIFSSVPRRESLWSALSGTSMASPHVAGSAALLRERHPSWTVAQLKSALVQTGDPVLDGPGGRETVASREGGGMLDLPHADNPLIFASPTGISFGLVRVGTSATRSVALTDAGGGAGDWRVSIVHQTGTAAVTAPATVTVPATLTVTATAPARAREADGNGFVVLTRGSDTRRIPYWFRVERPRLGQEPHRLLVTTGTYSATTRGGRSLVATYRYPELSNQLSIATVLSGPERVYRVRIAKPVANFGVAILGHGNGVRVTARLVAAGDENRLVGYAGVPININPYLTAFLQPAPVVGAIRPQPGAYDVVFDTVGNASFAGPFTFRFWINDVTPPAVRLLTPTLARGSTSPLQLAVTDAGSSVDPDSFVARVDTTSHSVSYDPSTGRASIQPGSLVPGRHRLFLQVSDYQETKNMEDVPPILPNTRRVSLTFTVTR